MVAAGSITVAVRVRPPTAAEAARLPEPSYEASIRGDGVLSTPKSVLNTATLREIVQIVDDRILTFDPDEKDRSRAFMERGFMPPGTKRYKDRRFMFDRVFNHETTQEEVFSATSKPLLQSVIDGFNATVFAYGATGCGKTHTISGTDSDPGIIYLTMADLFQRIEDRRDDWTVQVTVSFLEIYNEEIRDLLADPSLPPPRGGLSLREDKTVKVVGLTELKPQSAEEVKEIVLQGNLRRTQSPTHANETSSRSHAVLQVHIAQSPRTAALTEEQTMGTLSIIDLAGSERAAATTNMGQRMIEGANINKSLLALGNCINALCESGGAIRHIPYRNSKLTRLLKFSLGGNCKTVMIVCVAPTSLHFDDTHNTLIYAERATKIKTKVITRNVVNVDRHVGRYVEAINRLNLEVAELKAKLAANTSTELEILRRKKTEAAAEAERIKKDMIARTETTKAAIADGAVCSGKLAVANVKLAAIRARLAVLDSMASSSAMPLSSDLVAERALLRSLAEPEEQAIRPDSAVSVRLQRSSNSSAMFEATLRAVTERRSDRLDDVASDNIKVHVAGRRAEVERMKAEEERNAMRVGVEDMAEIIVQLVGMLGRCTVMIGEATNSLRRAEPGTDNTTHRVSTLLDNLRQSNDEAFTKLLGHSTESYTVSKNDDSLINFSGYNTTFARRVSSGPPVLQRTAGPSRRSSLSANTSLPPISPRRHHRSPRKSLRASLSGQPYRRAPDKDKKPKVVKSVQWRDVAGQGDLDDGGERPPSSLSIASTSTSATSKSSVLPRSASVNSESDWEDETERIDDSLNISFLKSLEANTSVMVPPKRPRAGRLGAGFLKSAARGPALGSLTEAEEPKSPVRRGSYPLVDMSLNRLGRSNSQSSSSSTSSSVTAKNPASPLKRSQSAKIISASAATSRRRSNIGPMRNEKGRRRSSLIPHLSPITRDNDTSGHAHHVAPRRVAVPVSPAKRKRVSLTRTMLNSSARAKGPARSITLANMSFDPNSSMETSFASKPKPTWR